MELTQELINKIESSFTIKEDIKPKKLYRVKFNGKFIVVRSQKTVWPGIGAAKSAILNHLQGLSYTNKNIDYYKCKEIRAELESMGLIEYVELNN
jgi:hypothetical protein